MPSLCGVCKAPLISSMQIARSKQEKIEKMIKNKFPENTEPKSNVQSPKAANRKGMDIEGGGSGTRKNSKASATGSKTICSGCDQEIVKEKDDDYFSECTDCGSPFCR